MCMPFWANKFDRFDWLIGFRLRRRAVGSNPVPIAGGEARQAAGRSRYRRERHQWRGCRRETEARAVHSRQRAVVNCSLQHRRRQQSSRSTVDRKLRYPVTCRRQGQETCVFRSDWTTVMRRDCWTSAWWSQSYKLQALPSNSILTTNQKPQ